MGTLLLVFSAIFDNDLRRVPTKLIFMDVLLVWGPTAPGHTVQYDSEHFPAN